MPGSDPVYREGILKSTTTIGQTAYLSTTDGTNPPTYGLLDANAADELATIAGVFMTGGVAGQRCSILVGGNYNPGFSATAGEMYIGTATAGGIAHIDDVASGWKIATVGVATTASNIKLNLFSSLTALA